MNYQEEVKKENLSESPEVKEEKNECPHCHCNEEEAHNQETCCCEKETSQLYGEDKKEEKKKRGFFDKKNESEELKLKITELEEENIRLKNEYLKAHADTENTRRRLQLDFEQSKKYRIQSFALDILPVIDNLERALAQETCVEAEGYRKGVEMIYQQLIHALAKEGIEEIEAMDQEFDPNFHQALVMEQKEGVEPGQVIDVLQKGYKLKDRILRAAMVKVSE